MFALNICLKQIVGLQWMCGIAIEIFVCNGQFNPTGLGSYHIQSQWFLKYRISRVNKEIYWNKNNEMFMTSWREYDADKISWKINPLHKRFKWRGQ